ncbi:uncharacterized protein G2W53_020408 [Senna tora]|uniref:Uncharacterized protein n=1 Tax=Senna tora TaxID=362788 RepID=A0A834U353_9FABA|nr:uncharacterized protein G2W53_020408 [Senna tora]
MGEKNQESRENKKEVGVTYKYNVVGT